MDFKYCDRCGEITSSNQAPQSTEILCAKCAGTAPASNDAPQASGLDLLEEPGGAPPPRTSSGGSMGTQDLEFFSNDTLAVRRERPQPAPSTKLKLVDDRAAEGPSLMKQNPATAKPGSEALGLTQPMRSVSAPASSDDRWRVDCLACGGSLSVRPVQKRSKLRCPRCRQAMALDPSGQILAIDTQQPAPTSAAGPPMGSAPEFGAPPELGSHSTPDPFASPAAPGIAASATGDGADFGSFPADTAAPRGPSATAVAPPPTTTQVGPSGMEFGISPDSPVGELPESTEELASALLGDESAVYTRPAQQPKTRPRTRSRTRVMGTRASTFSAFTWITLALLPSLAGVVLVHDASGAFGQALLQDVGETVVQNASRLMDWVAGMLGR